MIPKDSNYDDIDSELSSLVNDKLAQIKNSNAQKAKVTYSKYQKIEMIILKIIPISFFLFLGTPFAYSLYSTMPHIINSIRSGEMINHLVLISFLSDMPLSFKLSCLFGCFLFIAISICFAALINQRMSVPEYQDENYKSPFIIISALITCCLLMFLLFNSSFYFSQLISFCDNILFLLFMIASFIFCVLSYVTIQVIASNPLSNSLCFVVKSVLITIMIIMGMNYIAGLSFLAYSTSSFTNRYNQTLLNNFYLFTVSSSIVYYIAFLLYVLLLQIDLDYLYTTLLIRPDIEYFVDFNIRKVL